MRAELVTESFGGKSPPIEITISTAGSRGMTGQVYATIYGAGFEVVSNGCDGVMLSPGNATCRIAVRFAPAKVGMNAASLDVNAAPGGLVQVGLVGQGTP